MAPVRRTVEATWIVEGSSVVAKMEVENGSWIGPSSVTVVSWAKWVSHGEVA